MTLNYTLSNRNRNAIIEPNSYLDDMFTILPNVKTFIFLPGDYYITKILWVIKPGVKLTSSTGIARDVHIFQQNPGADGIVIRNCDRVELTNISVHNTFSGKIALTIAGSNNTITNGCYFYGCDDTFSVYYAGPTDLTEGISTLNGYFSGNLDNGNIFTRNVVYAKWSGDAVSYSLQKNGVFKRNIIRGGKIAVYMCTDCSIKSNIIYDSTSHGIFLSLPSNNVLINKNKIYECSSSGIKIGNQMEHGPFTPIPYNISILSNKIYDTKFYGIEMNDGNKIIVSGNNMISTDIHGIYAYRTIDLDVTNNKISYFRVAVWLENASNINVKNNNFNVIYPDPSLNVIKLTNNSNNISFENNSVNGLLKGPVSTFDSSCTNFITNNNTLDKYYTFDEELQIMKL